MKRFFRLVGSMQSSIGTVVQQDVVDRVVEATRLDAEAGGGVALRVEVDDQDLPTELGEGGTQIDGRRRLADPTLLVGDREDPAATREPTRPARPCLIRRVRCGLLSSLHRLQALYRPISPGGVAPYPARVLGPGQAASRPDSGARRTL